MRHLFCLLLFVVICVACSQEVRAVRAYPHPITLTQPDGKELLVRLCGSESFILMKIANFIYMFPKVAF